MKEYKKIGILGGTFNPIHTGHLILAENAYNLYDLDVVLIMPTGCSYLKDQSQIAPKNDRIAMVLSAISNNDHFLLSTVETDREGNTYTCDTLKELKSIYSDSELYYIIGADTLYSIESWYHPQEIFDLTNIIAAPRDMRSFDELKQQADYLMNKYNGSISLMQTSNIDISSHELRDRVKSGHGIRYYVPDGVYEYINNNHLYV